MQVTLADTGVSVEVESTVFDRPFNEPLIHQVMLAAVAASHTGTKAQKTRAEVRGGGAKPFRQKGTGRARAGTIRSPLWRKGGKVFAAKPMVYRQKVNKKMYRGAISSIFSELLRQGRLSVLENFSVETHRTRSFLEVIGRLGYEPDHLLLIIDALDENLYLASRNLRGVAVCDVPAIDPLSLLNSEKVVMTVPALRQLEEVLK